MGSIFYKKLKKCCFDLLFPHFIFYFFGLGYCDVTIIPRLLCLQMLRYATYCFYIPCLVLSSKVEQSARLILTCMLHPSTSHRAGWSYVIHGWLYFHPSMSLGSSISAALCIQPKIWCARSFYLTR